MCRLAAELAMAAIHGQDKDFLERLARGYTAAKARFANVPPYWPLHLYVSGEQKEKDGPRASMGMPTEEQVGLVPPSCHPGEQLCF